MNSTSNVPDRWLAQAPEYVSQTDFGESLHSLERLPGDARAGFFGPDSVTWRVSREAVVFLGAGRASLLQLAHPWVAAALMQHSSLIDDPISRFHGTFRVVYTMLFGTRAQALSAARFAYGVHSRIQGELPESATRGARSEHYEANEMGALRWVFTTLIESAVLAYEFVLPELSPAERDGYYNESKRMAMLFGVPPAALPNDRDELKRYSNAMVESQELGVDGYARELGRNLLSGAGTWVPIPGWYRALTMAWLSPKLREQFELPFGARERNAIRRAHALLPVFYRSLPDALRFVGPYYEARARLRGQQPGPLTRRSNLFWIGQRQMLFPQLPG